MKLVVKSLVIELLGLDGGPRRPILDLSEGVLLDRMPGTAVEHIRAYVRAFSNKIVTN